MQSLLLASLLLSTPTPQPADNTFLPPTSALAVQLDAVLPYVDTDFVQFGFVLVKQGALVQPPLESVELITCTTKQILTRTQNSEIFQGCTVTQADAAPEGALTFTFSEFLLLLAGQPAS